MARCEKCGSAATVEIVFATSGGLVAVPKVQRKKMFPKYSYMTGRACTDCGAVFDVRLNEPEKFRSFVDYSAQARGDGN